VLTSASGTFRRPTTVAQDQRRRQPRTYRQAVVVPDIEPGGDAQVDVAVVHVGERY
jgi:hypothetical protein